MLGDFTQLNAISAYFHLKIIAANINDLPIIPLIHQITGFIQTGIVIRPLIPFGAIRIDDEFLRRQRRFIQIAARQSDAGKVEFTHRTGRQKPLPFVRDQHFHVINRPPDQDVIYIRIVTVEIQHIDGGFGWPIKIVQGDMRQTLLNPFDWVSLSSSPLQNT